MKRTIVIISTVLTGCVLSAALKPASPEKYMDFYTQKLISFKKDLSELHNSILNTPLNDNYKELILAKINKNRISLKELDFWLRYFEPVAYKKINGPLPVEWETEVFEKFEAPYKREGAGLTLATTYLSEQEVNRDSLAILINSSASAIDVFLADSITVNLKKHHHFFLANRLHLLNLAAVYTTGFECPDESRIIPELLHMIESTFRMYAIYDLGHPTYKLSRQYVSLYQDMISFVKNQPANYESFDHFSFVQKYVEPLYRLNREMILDYQVISNNFNDYSINKYAVSVFDKTLFRGQNGKGVYIGIDDEIQLQELKAIGKLLFHDPILSQNNKRSCASCHNPATFFTDTVLTTGLQFDGIKYLPRNTPSLLNVIHNHLLMLDGKHFNLENQTKDVLTNPIEMASTESEVVEKVMSCNEYKSVFKKYLKATPQYNAVNIEHISSALILYYADFSYYTSAFDLAMTKNKPVSKEIQNGFNLFMSKAKCGTCHFLPQFNGNKPPYISSEFEVIGVPQDTGFNRLSNDKGRFTVNPAKEMESAFRTPTIRNLSFTKPYMHNGIFKTQEEVIDFYDAGGGAGKGMLVPNQTLPADSLRLTKAEKKDLLAFINSLDEDIPLQLPPVKLPTSKNKALNNRVTGGQY